MDSLVERWFPANEPAPHGEPVIAEFRAYNYPNGEVRQQVVWWWEGEWRSYPSTENRAYVDRWKQMPMAAILQSELLEQAHLLGKGAEREARLQARVEELERGNARLRALLKPFAEAADRAERRAGWDGPLDPLVSLEACRNARQALKEQADADQ